MLHITVLRDGGMEGVCEGSKPTSSRDESMSWRSCKRDLCLRHSRRQTPWEIQFRPAASVHVLFLVALCLEYPSQ